MVEINEKYREKVICEIINDHVDEEGVEHEDQGLQGFDFDLFDEEREGCVGDDVGELTDLLMLTMLWPGDWWEQLDRMKNKVDQDNGRGGTQ